MPTLIRKLPAFMLALLALVVVSCNTNDNPIDPGTEPGRPTALAAQSRSATSVALKWDAPASGVTPSGYRLKYNVTGNATSDSLTVSGASTTTAVVTGLTEGTTYEFTVSALNGSTSGLATSSLAWAPARRTGNLRLYSNRSVNGSGLVIFDGVPRQAPIGLGQLWDLAFDDKFDASRPVIASPGQTAYVNSEVKFTNGQTAKIVFLGRQYPGVNSLDDIWETEDLNDAVIDSLRENAYDLSSAGGTGGLAFVFASKNNVTGKFNYGKVLVHRTNGTFVQGSGDEKYIEVEVSYQTAADVPYALRNKLAEAETRVSTPTRPGVR